ncbi:hypothetical protein D3C73_1183570 [compost metagenome]
MVIINNTPAMETAMSLMLFRKLLLFSIFFIAIECSSLSSLLLSVSLIIIWTTIGTRSIRETNSVTIQAMFRMKDKKFVCNTLGTMIDVTNRMAPTAAPTSFLSSAFEYVFRIMSLIGIFVVLTIGISALITVRTIPKAMEPRS